MCKGVNNVDGVTPGGSLIYSNNMLYGTCQNGGQYGGGTLYSLNLDGSNFQVLHAFQITDGRYPFSPLLLNNTIYGVTAGGGVNSNGSMYSYKFPTISPITPPVSNICFPEKTPIVTDQGIISIEKINPELHTIRDQKIKKSKQSHKLLHKTHILFVLKQILSVKIIPRNQQP